MAGPPTPLGANYRRLLTSSAVANLADGVGVVAFPWLASAVTRNPIHIAAVAVATRLPWLLFTLPAGVITDRADRRTLVASMDLVRFVVTGLFALAVWVGADRLVDPSVAEPTGTDTGLLAAVYVAALALGTAEVLRDNGAQTLMPSVVASEHLERANGRLWGAETVMNQFVGPPVAGVLLGVGFVLPFGVIAAVFAVAGATMFTVGGDFRARPAPGVVEAAEDGPRPGWRAEIVEALRWLWAHPVLRPMALILGGLNFVLTMQLATLVLFAQEVLGLDAGGFGRLMAVVALGGVAGAFTAERVSARIGQGPSLFVTLGLSTLTSLAMGLAPGVVFFAVVMAVDSYLALLWNVVTVAFRQSVIPDHLLGRVNSVYRLLSWGAIPLGGLAGGLVVEATDAVASRETALRMPFVVAALGCLFLLVVALPRLGTDKLQEARDRAP